MVAVVLVRFRTKVMDSNTRVHSHYPHLDEDEWKMVCKLSSVIGEAATLQILLLSKEEQKKALRQAMTSMNKQESNVVAPIVGTTKVKIETSIYQAHEYESLP